MCYLFYHFSMNLQLSMREMEFMTKTDKPKSKVCEHLSWNVLMLVFFGIPG